MNKKIISFFLLLIICSGNVSPVLAAFVTSTYESSNDRVRADFNPSGVGGYTVELFRSGTRVLNTSFNSTQVSGVHYLSCNGSWQMTFYDYADNVLATESINVTQIQSEPAGCSANDPEPGTGEGGSGEGCIGCDLFNCPGWGTYMGKIDQIIGAIPPPPNWQQVAGIFRDTIAPRIKADMEDLLGYAPTPDPIPRGTVPGAVLPEKEPEIDMVIELGDEPTEPGGKEAPGLGESTFDEDDIKNEAPKIPERTDPTGGFKILDPISGLPSQEEFEKNKPIEGEAPLPTDPKDPDNFSPKPEEGENKAPTPPEQDNYIPTDPGDPDNYAPTPGDDTGTAPIPGDSNDTAPLPDENGTAPLPGS